MDSSDLLLAGDDSSWNMSDWRWDSVGFFAVPKLAQQATSSCCKKRKTVNFLASERQPRQCGDCTYIEQGPLKLLQQASDSAGSNSCGDAADCKQQVTVPAASPAAKSSSAGPRPVTAVHASTESTCQADGCRCDMSKQSVWHQKSRICDKHMSGTFLKQGKHQQFCQQCGRSHNPDAFDQGRRSCRTQLAKHAARRRKRSAATSTIDTSGPDIPGHVAGTSAATGCRAAVSIAALAMRDTSPDAWFQTLCDSQKAAEDQSLAQPLDARQRHSSGHTQFSSQAAAPAGYSNLPQQAYSATTSAVRLSIKLFNCTPAQLPGSLRETVTGWLGSTPAGLEGYIRPGCVHLTVQATMPTRQAQGAVASTGPDISIRSAVDHLLASPKQEVWHRCTMLVQLGDEAAVVHEGKPLKMLHSTVTSEETADMLQVALPGEVPAGLLYLEVQRGSFMGPALPVLVAPTPALAAEAAHMLQRTRPCDRQGLIVDLGCAMQYTLASRLPKSASPEPAVSGMPVVQILLPLLARAAQSGLDALVRHFKRVVAHDDMSAVATFRVQSGMGLLHLGVQSGKLAVLAALLEESNAELWQDGLDGPGGISPFHLAVFLPEAQSVALLLSATLGASHWFCCTTHDGLTPADFAVRCGKDHLNHAIGAFMWSQASAGKSLSQPDGEVDVEKQPFEPCIKQVSAAGQQPSGSASSWSDSSSSADDSGSDVDASQHGGDRLSVMPAASCARSQGLSAAAKFVQEQRGRLAAVLRQVSWFQNPNAQ
ncbi:hypothetical protein WJX82_005883 [Trebouxia sp. C0006]